MAGSLYVCRRQEIQADKLMPFFDEHGLSQILARILSISRISALLARNVSRKQSRSLCGHGLRKVKLSCLSPLYKLGPVRLLVIVESRCATPW